MTQSTTATARATTSRPTTSRPPTARTHSFALAPLPQPFRPPVASSRQSRIALTPRSSADSTLGLEFARGDGKLETGIGVSWEAVREALWERRGGSVGEGGW